MDQLVKYPLNGWQLIIDQDPVCIREAWSGGGSENRCQCKDPLS